MDQILCDSHLYHYITYRAYTIKDMHSGRHMYAKLNVQDYIVTDGMSDVTK